MQPDRNDDMAKKIKALRAQNDLTLEQVANEVGVGKSTVRKWEVGMIANMRRDKIAALAKALHTTPGYLMGWDDDEAPDQTEAPAEREITADDVIDWIERKATRDELVRFINACLEKIK